HQLADLEPDIESEERGEEMITRELQRLAQRERKAEAVNEPERKRDDPAPRHGTVAAERGTDDVLERHVEDGDGDERFDQRWEPEHIGGEAESRGQKCDRMRDRERGHNDDEEAQPSEWNHQACQKQEMIDALDDVPEAGHDKTQRGLMPARVELHEPRVAVEFERARRAVG